MPYGLAHGHKIQVFYKNGKNFTVLDFFSGTQALKIWIYSEQVFFRLSRISSVMFSWMTAEVLLLNNMSIFYYFFNIFSRFFSQILSDFSIFRFFSIKKISSTPLPIFSRMIFRHNSRMSETLNICTYKLKPPLPLPYLFKILFWSWCILNQKSEVTEHVAQSRS